MSDFLPLEIQSEIIQRLPVRSLIQFRSVSRAWKALIDSPEFIAAYSLRHIYPHHLLIRYEDMAEIEEKYVCFVDDDTFPQQKFAHTVPLSIKLLHHSHIVGSSAGLFCLYGSYLHPDHHVPNNANVTAVLWNPSIRKSVPINVPDGKYGIHGHVLGFGVCPVTSDPKIVKITHPDSWWLTKSKKSIPWNVKVYALSSGEWRTPSCNLPLQSIEVTWDQVVVDRFIYWLAYNRIAINDVFQTSYTIMSFDMTTDEFREVYLPDSLAHSSNQITVSKVWESLVVLEYCDKTFCIVWMMEHGVPKSFTKLFTFKTPYASIEALGFRKSGEPIMEKLDDFESCSGRVPLVVYEPYSERIHDFGISGICGSFLVISYTETLLLLNQ